MEQVDPIRLLLSGAAGVPRSVAMRLIGHKTEAIYRRYAIVSETDLSDGVAKLSLFHGRGEQKPIRVVIPLAVRTGKAEVKQQAFSG